MIINKIDYTLLYTTPKTEENLKKMLCDFFYYNTEKYGEPTIELIPFYKDVLFKLIWNNKDVDLFICTKNNRYRLLML